MFLTILLKVMFSHTHPRATNHKDAFHDLHSVFKTGRQLSFPIPSLPLPHTCMRIRCWEPARGRPPRPYSLWCYRRNTDVESASCRFTWHFTPSYRNGEAKGQVALWILSLLRRPSEILTVAITEFLITLWTEWANKLN